MITDKQFIEENHCLIRSVVDIVASTHSPEEKEDLVHDIIIKLLESEIEVDDGYASMSAYLTRMCKNMLINEERDKQVEAITHAISMDEEVRGENDVSTLHDKIPSDFLPDGEVLYVGDGVDHSSQRYRHQIENLASYMPVTWGIIFHYRYYWGMLPTEIAEWLGWSANKVRGILKRAVHRARELSETRYPVRDRYNGLTLQEMYLGCLPDRLLYPFKWYYSDGMSYIRISELTGLEVEELKLDVELAEKILEENYGYRIR